MPAALALPALAVGALSVRVIMDDDFLQRYNLNFNDFLLSQPRVFTLRALTINQLPRRLLSDESQPRNMSSEIA